jgi:hypothetical protein
MSEKSQSQTEDSQEKSIEPGSMGILLKEAGVDVEHLGPDAKGVEQILVTTDQLLQVSEILRDHDKAHFDLLD